MGKRYLVKHWCNADFIMEKIVDESEINTKTNDLGKHKYPDANWSMVMIKDSEKIKRTSYEEYDERINNSDKKRTSDK
tara:strand:- start:2676 stop:2909 length:234 start_codon:yes stop_codon:yes gene_type:complete